MPLATTPEVKIPLLVAELHVMVEIDPGINGITAADADEGAELPATLVATTVNVYAVPLVKPVTTRGELVPVEVKPPGEDVTV